MGRSGGPNRNPSALVASASAKRGDRKILAPAATTDTDPGHVIFETIIPLYS